MATNTSDYAFPAHFRFTEPALRFHPERGADQHVHPLTGLVEYGPYSRSVLNLVMDPLRIAFIAPSGAHGNLRRLLRELETTHHPIERKAYLPIFPGFSRVFGLRVVESPDVQKTLQSPLANADVAPFLSLANSMTSVLQELSVRRSEFDVAMIFLPKEWSSAFEHDDGFDLHDFTKAKAAELGIPTQFVGNGPSQALAYRCRCSVAWRLGIAIYTKAGGIPWKLADAPQDAAYIGLSYALRQGGSERGRRFVTCCSQVFDADGAGLEFVAYETEDFSIHRDNPFLSRAEMRRVMARSLLLYQRRHAGRMPRTVTVYKSTEFRSEEVEGCLDAWSAVESLELLYIQKDTIWRGVDVQKKKTPGKYPCERGICLPIGDRDILLWTQGNAREAADGRDFFKEGKGIPSPLLIQRFAGHGGWSDTCRAILGLTKMNWNNDGLYDRVPVTLSHAQELANIIKRVDVVSPRPYQVRLFI